MSRTKEYKNKLLEKQTYKLKDAVIIVEPVFKDVGSRTLLYSLSQMIRKDNKF